MEARMRDRSVAWFVWPFAKGRPGCCGDGWARELNPFIFYGGGGSGRSQTSALVIVRPTVQRERGDCFRVPESCLREGNERAARRMMRGTAAGTGMIEGTSVLLSPALVISERRRQHALGLALEADRAERLGCGANGVKTPTCQRENFTKSNIPAISLPGDRFNESTPARGPTA
ncbi:hypothetical protein BD779DRAFT_1743328 [Infundibulicybe gibba]|nr:hypothetical protein BD779DRAFT_1743328 [Infundibulicybe gibba]